jgi:hypothetical protein
LGILLQRLISLESWYGDMRDRPRSISRKPWAAYLGLPYYGTKSAPKKFPKALHPRAATNGRILLIRRKKHNEVRLKTAYIYPQPASTLCERAGYVAAIFRWATLAPPGMNRCFVRWRGKGLKRRQIH